MPVIEVKNVKKYYGDVRGVENLSFSVEKGEIYGFLGPNGAGKTTTVKILVKIIKNYTGEVKVFGKDFRKWGKDYYNRIGVSFEFPAVYSRLTALENLEFFASFYKKHLDPVEVLKTCQRLQRLSDGPHCSSGMAGTACVAVPEKGSLRTPYTSQLFSTLSHGMHKGSCCGVRFYKVTFEDLLGVRKWRPSKTPV